jgi:NitT/TauT family transport system permease protein
MYASRFGIGHLIFGWGEAYQLPQLLAGVIIISVITIIVNEGMRLIEISAARRYGALRR